MSDGLEFDVKCNQECIIPNLEKECKLENLNTVLSIVSNEKDNLLGKKYLSEKFIETLENKQFSSNNNNLYSELDIEKNEKTLIREGDENPEIKSKNKSKSKLLKVSDQIQIQKEIKKQQKIRKNEFVESEAELGSDKEEHDDVVKKIKENDEESDDQEEDLPDLIDKTEGIIEDNDEIKKKFYNEMMDQDKKEINQVINGPAQRQKRLRSNIDKLGDTEDDYLALNMRIKKYKTNSTEEENESGFIGNFLNLQKQYEEETNEENMDEELTQMVQTYQNKIIKKIAEKSQKIDDLIELRNKENDKILENVVIRNGASHINLENASNTSKSKAVINKQNLAMNFKYKSVTQQTSLLFGNKQDNPLISKSNNNSQYKSVTNLNISGSTQSQSTTINPFLHNQNKTNLSSLFRKTAQIQKLDKQKNQNTLSSGKKHAKKNQNLENFTNSLQNCK